jgi:hypothetical protein
MNKDFSNIQHAVNVQLDAVTPEAFSVTTIVQTIVSEATDYAKKSLDASRVFVENLVSAKSLHTVTSPRQASSRLDRRSPTCRARSNRFCSIRALGMRAARFPIKWTDVVG